MNYSKKLETQADRLLNRPRRKTRRAIKKKKPKSAKWTKEFNKAMEEHREAKIELALHWKEANRLMDKE